MTTLLEVVNTVLNKLGEGSVDTVQRNNASILCAENVRVAIRSLALDNHHWSWLTGAYTADNWNNEKATFNGEILIIQYIADAGSNNRVLTFVTPRDFNRYTLLSYTGTSGGALVYTYEGDAIKLHPYPNDTVARNNIRFIGSVLNPLPTSDSDTLQVADRDLNVLIFRVLMMMAIDHLKEADLAQVYAMEYDRALQSAKHRMILELGRENSAIW